jgi:hypothetical protein
VLVVAEGVDVAGVTTVFVVGVDLLEELPELELDAGVDPELLGVLLLGLGADPE